MNSISVVLLTFIITINLWGQDFYDINSINTIEITFEQSNWDYLLDSLYADGNENRLTGKATVNGIQYNEVGVRYKGNSSYNANQIKNPLNIKLDYIIDDQEHEGYGTLKLANVSKDPSFIREVLSYEIAREYMPACLANFSKVTINGSYLGLYTSVQDVDKHFLRTHYYNGDNPSFKGELASGETPTVVKTWGYFGPDSTSYYNYYELDSDYGWSELITFLDVLNNTPTEVSTVLNVDRHLWMLAFDNLLVNLDAPINFAHNYYLYQDDAGRFNPIIWDLNESFGGFSMLLDGPPLNITDMQQMDPFLNLNNANYPIINKILSDPTYKKTYVAHMKTIMDEFFSNGNYRTRALEIQNIIDSEVQNDPNKFFSYSEFINNLDNSTGSFSPPPHQNQAIAGITELMEARITYLNSQAEFQAEAPTIAAVSHNPVQVSPNSDVQITAEVSGAGQVMLACRNSQTEIFEKVELFDDGNHNDGSAGDGVYGNTVSVSYGEFQYYIFAENDDAVAFSPQRAEYEFYSLMTVGDVVVNEFMADNDGIVADSNGDYDDWIELYNNTDQEISLYGYFLSDAGDDLAQWTFPDTSISANGYLIVWADKDDDQEGLHANFKLSASGETIYLSDPDTTIIDEIAFSEQTTDLSTGRYPNGTGEFVEMEPTFTTANQRGITSVCDDNSSQQIPKIIQLSQNFPNPFNPVTTISFSLPKEDKITLTIYNTLGQKVAILADDVYSAGNYSMQWNAGNYSSGIYIYAIQSGNQHITRKMILMK